MFFKDLIIKDGVREVVEFESRYLIEINGESIAFFDLEDALNSGLFTDKCNELGYSIDRMIHKGNGDMIAFDVDNSFRVGYCDEGYSVMFWSNKNVDNLDTGFQGDGFEGSIKELLTDEGMKFFKISQ